MININVLYYHCKCVRWSVQITPDDYSDDCFTRHLNSDCIKRLLHNALDASHSHRDCIRQLFNILHNQFKQHWEK